VQPQEAFVFHVGSMNGLSADYLPPAFVSAMLSIRWGLIGLGIALPLAALLLPRLTGSPSRSLVLPCAVLQALAMFLMAVAFHQFPDEVFINLTQSKNLAEAGRYSFYADRNVDGTNDGLFYVLVGGLHKTGIPAPLGALVLGAACAAASIGLLYRHAFLVTESHVLAWIATFLASILECFGRLSGSGWSASLIGLLAVTAMLLWRSRRWPWTFAVTGLFPLCRYDFAFYTVVTGVLLVWISARNVDRPWRRTATCWAASLAGVAAVALFWRIYYGHFVPTCVQMKASSYGSAASVADGILQYARELWPFILIVFAGSWFTPRARFLAPLPWLAAGLAHFALVLWGGGDYFPGNRYQVVLTTAVLFAGIECLPGVSRAILGVFRRSEFPAELSKGRWVVACATVVVLGVFAQFRPASTRETIDGMLASHRKPDRSTWIDSRGLEAMTVSRLNNHAATGRFFSRLAKGHPGTRLASLEVASTFYFFDGVSLDALGFVNPVVAAGPRNPAPRRQWDKRLDPKFWERERPEIIWLDTSTEVLDYMRLDPFMPIESMLWWSRHYNWTQPYLDSEYLRVHYRPRASLVNGAWLILWLAREDVAREYDRTLAHEGFRLRADFP
jgi:hypothetical protein